MSNSKLLFGGAILLAGLLISGPVFGASLTINTATQMDSITIGDGNSLTVGGSGHLKLGGTGEVFTGHSGSTLTFNGGSKLELNGDLAQSLNPVKSGFGVERLIFSGAGAKTFASSVQINDNWDADGAGAGMSPAISIENGVTVTLASGVNVYVASSTLGLTGSGSLASAASATIHYLSTGALDAWVVGEAGYGNLTHNGTGELSLTAATTCQGTLTNTSGNLDADSSGITATRLIWQAGTLSNSGAWDIGSNGVTISGGAITAPGTIACGGNWALSGGTFAPGTNSVTFDGAGLTIDPGGQPFYNVTISENASLAGAMSLADAGTLTVPSGKTFDLGGFGLTSGGTATVSNAGIIEADGDQTISGITWDTDSGTTRFSDASGATLSNVPAAVFDLEIQGGSTITLGQATDVNGNLTVASGTTFNTATHNLTLGDASGARTVTNSGTWSVPTGGTVTCVDDVTFAGSAMNFYNFSCTTAGTALKFENSTTYQVDGALTLTGASGDLISLNTDDGLGAAFTIQDDGTEDVSYVSVANSTATVGIRASYSSDGGGNTNWIFPVIAVASGNWDSTGANVWGLGVGISPANDDVVEIPNTFTVTLTVAEQAAELTVANGGSLACADQMMTVTGASDIDGTVTISTGTYDANGAFDATNGTITFSDAGNLQLAGVVTSLGTLTNTVGTVTYDGAAQTIFSDNYYSLSTGGTNTKTLGGAIDVDGTLSIASDTTLATSDNGINVAGNFSNSGTFTPGTGLVALDGTGAQSLVQGTGSFYDLTVSEAGAVTVTGALDVDRNLSLTGGTLVLGTTVDIGTSAGSGSLSISSGADWTKGSGAVRFAGTCTLSDADGDNNLGAVQVNEEE